MRDDFPQYVVDVLAKRVGMRCSNPACRQPTSGPRSDSSKVVSIGVASHITAASFGGPRFDSSLTPEQRGSVTNGIWLCQNCAKLVDNDIELYKVKVLLDWKNLAETSALSDLNGDINFQVQSSPVIDIAKVSFSWKRLLITSDLHKYKIETIVHNVGNKPLKDYHLDFTFPTAVIEQPDNHSLFVPNRSDDLSSLFRYIARDQKDIIYPGDKVVLITLEYHMTTTLYWIHDKLFMSPIKASLYCENEQEFLIEDTFAEFQCF